MFNRIRSAAYPLLPDVHRTQVCHVLVLDQGMYIQKPSQNTKRHSEDIKSLSFGNFGRMMGNPESELPCEYNSSHNDDSQHLLGSKSFYTVC